LLLGGRGIAAGNRPGRVYIGTRRLLWRAPRMDEAEAYDLAIGVDADPRIEVLVRDECDEAEAVVVLDHSA
jgi:hypothetical protein